jgi:hypothetical protein
MNSSILKERFNAFVAAAGHTEVSPVKHAGIVEPVLLLVPLAWAALHDLDRQARLSGSPPHSSASSRSIIDALNLSPSGDLGASGVQRGSLLWRC